MCIEHRQTSSSKPQLLCLPIQPGRGNMCRIGLCRICLDRLLGFTVPVQPNLRAVKRQQDLKTTMNLIKLLSTDFFTGQILFSGKGLLDILWYLIRNPRAKSLRLAVLILQLIPRYTKVSVKRLINLHRLTQEANRLNLLGDIVECGVWNGGSAAIMGVADRDDEASGKARKLWLFDSFRGLPRPSNRDGKQATANYFQGWCHGETGKVERIFRRFRLSLQHVNIIPGWFDDTLGTADLQTIALLHIDADWYASVKVVLETLYDKVVEGGFVVLDDYWRWPGCREAVTDYLKEHQIQGVVLKQVDLHGVYFQKPHRCRRVTIDN